MAHNAHNANAQKVNMTFRIERELYEKMKKHSDIKWSEAARKGIKEKLEELGELKGYVRGRELLKELSEEARKALKEIPESEWKKGYKEMRRKGWQKAKSLMRAS